MSHGTPAPPPSASPCRSNPSSRATASTGARSIPSPDRDIAAGACATAPPNESDSFSVNSCLLMTLSPRLVGLRLLTADSPQLTVYSPEFLPVGCRLWTVGFELPTLSPCYTAPSRHAHPRSLHCS